MIVTLRKELTGAGFDWKTGKIIYQESDNADSPHWGDPISAQYIEQTHPLLDQEYDCGHGGPECPRFIAEDDKALYFPSQYDGATNMVRVWKDINHYLNWKENPTPCPGS
jgi:hypothetical protein